jgi:hypothetical protein
VSESSEHSAAGPSVHPADDKPGSESSPVGGTSAPAEGGGAQQRAEPGSPPPGSNQGKDEPESSVPDGGSGPDRDESGTVGTGNPQLGTVTTGGGPVGPNAGGSPTAGQEQARTGMTPAESRPRPDEQSSPGMGTPGKPANDTSGDVASRSRGGAEGASPEPIETDVEAGANRTAPGSPPDSAAPPVPTPGIAHGVSVPSTEPMAGTSEESNIVHGVKTPHSTTERAGGTPGHPAIAPRPSAPDGEVSPT